LLDSSLELVRIFLCIIMLSIATVFDIRKREVNDLIWVVFGALGIGIIFLHSSPGEELLKVGISAIVIPVAFFVWRIGFFGGADAFAIVTISILAPGISLTETVVTPFSTLTNAISISLITILANITRNVASLLLGKNIFDGFDETNTKKILAMFIGYRASNPKYAFSIEQEAVRGKKLNLTPRHAENSEFCDRKDTWVSPAVPYVMFITAGFIAQLFVGDILLQIIQNV
jgi:archaeal preflagellin peptidase FlaK